MRLGALDSASLPGLRMASRLFVLVCSLASCGTSASERYDCSDQADCACLSDADCVVSPCGPSVAEFHCDPDCPCTNGWPVTVAEGAAMNELSSLESCGNCAMQGGVRHCLHVNCEMWTLEPRCELGRCVGVRVDE